MHLATCPDVQPGLCLCCWHATKLGFIDLDPLQSNIGHYGFGLVDS